MYIVIICSSIALLFTYLESIGKFRHGMSWGFILVTFLGVIHYQYGSDYMEYYETYKEIESTPFNLGLVMNREVYREPGWTLLNYLFRYLGGFFTMVAVLNIVQNVIVYKFIRREVAKKWWPMAVFIYLFVSSYYLMSFSMMRQEFVMIVFLGLWKWINQRKWLRSLAIIFLCSFIHSSSLIFLPFAFWGYIPSNNRRLLSILYIVFLILLWFNTQFVGSILDMFYQYEKFNEFENIYQDDSRSLHLGIGFFVNLLPFVVLISYVWNSKNIKTDNDVKLVLLSSVGFLIQPFSQFIALISRVGLYFSIFSIAALPIAYSSIKNKELRYGLLFIYIMIVCLDYYLFFRNPLWAKSYTTFHTVFEVL